MSCAKGMVLCPSCEKNLSLGKINEYDVEVSRVLYGIFREEADFIHAIDTENHLVIVVKAEDVGEVIGKGGANLRILTERLGRTVKVIGRDSFKETVTALIAPARVTGVNEVLKPGGGKAVRVRINREDQNRLRMSLPDLQKLVSAVTDQEVQLSWEY